MVHYICDGVGHPPHMDPMEHKILLLFILYKTKTANKEINMQCSELQKKYVRGHVLEEQAQGKRGANYAITIIMLDLSLILSPF